MIRPVGAVSPYILLAVAAVPFLAGSGLKRLLRRQLGGRVVSAALIVVLLAGGLFATQLPSHRFERATAPRSDALAAAAAIIGRGARTGDAVVFLPRRYRAAALAYPESFALANDVALRQTPIQANNLRGNDWPAPQLRTRLLATTRVWVIGRPHLNVRAGERDAASARQVLQDHFIRERSYAVHGLNIVLYVRTGTPR